MDIAAAASELTFASRSPEVLAGSLALLPSSLDTPAGVAQALRALADFEAFSASLRALLVDRQTQHVAEQPLGGRDGQPQRLGGEIAHAAAVTEIATLQNTSEAAAARAVNFSVALVNVHPALHEALAAGDISEAHARAVVDQAATLPEHVAEAFGIEALSRLRTQRGRLRTPGEFRGVVRELRERLHPESIVRRRAAAREDRRVWLQPEEDGMCTLAALLPAETAKSLYERVDGVARAARARDGEHRTLPQLRADALVQLGLGTRPNRGGHVTCGAVEGRTAEGATVEDSRSGGSDASRSLAAAGGHGDVIPSLEDLLSTVKAEVVVHVPLAVAVGASDDVAYLEGCGVIDATTARLLAAAAPTWQRIFTDDDGVPVRLGRSVYRPPAGLVRFIQYRDGTCLVPGCTCAARRSEIDHTIEWQDGGTTDAENLTLLCAKHHALKSLALFRLRREALAAHSGPDAAHVGTGAHIGTGARVGAGTQGDPPKVSGELVWQTLLGEEYPAEPTDRGHVLGARPPELVSSTEALSTGPLPAAQPQGPVPRHGGNEHLVGNEHHGGNRHQREGEHHGGNRHQREGEHHGGNRHQREGEHHGGNRHRGEGEHQGEAAPSSITPGNEPPF